MANVLRVRLNASPEQFERLRALQAAFADVCNAIWPVVQNTRCWNRVALHHLVYRDMRERFPSLGSQMICNAVYSVSRVSRAIFQDPGSPWNVHKRFGSPLPGARFAPSAPVYFDRHTLSLKGSALSMFTLDGRMLFDLRLAPADVARFHQEKLIEVVLLLRAGGFELDFRFADRDAQEVDETADERPFPEYLLVMPAEETPQPPSESSTTNGRPGAAAAS